MDSPDKLFERTQPGSLVQCRVTKIDITRFNVELTCKSAELKVYFSEYLSVEFLR